MAIYNPPKKSGLGNTLESIGTGISASGAATTLAGGIASLTVVGAPVGLGMAAAGAITSLIGSGVSAVGGMFNQGEEAKQEMYNQRYNTVVEGEGNQRQSAQNSENAYLYNQQGVSSSVKAINQMISPTTSNKGLVNNRLI